MKKALFAVIISMVSGLNSHANESKTCESIIEEVSIDASTDFSSYLLFLSQENILTENDLLSLLQSLERNTLINPLSESYKHLNSSAGLVHYKQLQLFVDHYNKDPHYLDLKLIQEKLEKQLKIKTGEKVERASAEELTNFESIAAKILTKTIENKDFTKLVPTLIEKYPYSIKKFADYLYNSDKASLVRDGKLILEEFYKDADKRQTTDYEEYLVSLINNQETTTDELRRHLSQLEKVTSPYLYTSLDDLMKKNNRSDSFIINKVIQLTILDDDPQLIKKLLEIEKVSNNYFIEARLFAIEKLIELTIKGKNINLPDINQYYKDVYSKILANRSDKISLELIKKGIESKEPEIKEEAIKALAGRKDPESIKIIKNLFGFFPTERQLYIILDLITGRDDPWALSFLKQHLNDGKISSSIYRGFHGMSSRASRDVIENIFNNAKTDQLRDDAAYAINARPNEDLVYFFEKYVNEKDHRFATTAILTAENYNREIAQFTQYCLDKSVKSLELENACDKYLKKINLMKLSLVKNSESFKISSCAEELKQFIMSKQTLRGGFHHCYTYLQGLPLEKTKEAWLSLTPLFWEHLKMNQNNVPNTYLTTAFSKSIEAKDKETIKKAIPFIEMALQNEHQAFAVGLLTGYSHPQFIQTCQDLILNSATNILSSLLGKWGGCLNYLTSLPLNDRKDFWMKISGPSFNGHARKMAIKKLAESNDPDVFKLIEQYAKANDPQLLNEVSNTYLTLILARHEQTLHNGSL